MGNGKATRHYPREINFVLLPTCSDTAQNLNASESYQSSSPQSFRSNNLTSPQNVVFCERSEGINSQIGILDLWFGVTNDERQNV